MADKPSKKSSPGFGGTKPKNVDPEGNKVETKKGSSPK